MANIYWNKKKVLQEEIFAELMKKMPLTTDEAFTVRFEDGIAVCISERKSNENKLETPYKAGHWDIIPPQVLGWRIIKKIVPKGYIKVFYENSE